MTDDELIELNRKSIVDDDAYRMADIAAKCHGPQPILVDIGANVGWWTRHWLMHVPRGTAFCYEPLTENWKRIPNDPHIVKYEYAVSTATRLMTFYRHTGTQHQGPENSQLWSALPDFKGPVTAKCEVSAVAFRDVLWRYPRIHVLKIDIEGHEREILDSIAPMDLSHVDVLSLEDHVGCDREVIELAGLRVWFHAYKSPNHPVYLHQRLWDAFA